MKRRYRGKSRVTDDVSRDKEWQDGRLATAQTKKQEKRRNIFQAQWQQLYSLCSDSGSRARLINLRDQFDRQQRGVSEPAQVETEVAVLMRQAGFSIAFLEESEARTADLECYFGVDRLFVEITAIVPNPSVRRGPWLTMSQESGRSFMGDDLHQDVLVRRLIARMAEKARQLSRYCAPVLLAVTVPPIEWIDEPLYSQEKVDLQRLAGLLSTALCGIPQLSGVLLTCWNLSARPARSNIRLSNAYWVARSEGDLMLPRVRLMVVNHSAAYCLGDKEVGALKAVM